MDEKKEGTKNEGEVFPPIKIELEKVPMSWADMCESSDEDSGPMEVEVDESIEKPKKPLLPKNTPIETALERMVTEEEPFTMVKRRRRNAVSNKRIECIKCGTSFLFTVMEQEDYKQRRWCEPKTCLRCRKSRKRQRFQR